MRNHKKHLVMPMSMVGGSGDGNQPTLFAPIIIVSGNNVTWERDSRNGGFGDTLDATIDNESVSKPLSITPELDSKLLKVKSIAENFKDGVATQVLEYISVRPVTKRFSILIDEIQEPPYGTYPYMTISARVTDKDGNSVGSLLLNKAKWRCKGVDYPIDGTSGGVNANQQCGFHVIVPQQTGQQELEFYFELLENVVPTNGLRFSFSCVRTGSLYPTDDYREAGSITQTGMSGFDCHAFIDDQLSGTQSTFGAGAFMDGSACVATGTINAKRW